MSEELDKIVQRYERRKNKSFKNDWKYSYFIQSEREFIYLEILKSKFKSLIDLKLLEIGAGAGGNLNFFHRIGFKYENIYANELLFERVEKLKINVPTPNIFLGDALSLDFCENFDVVFQSTVFTSILDFGFKKRLAKKMMDMTKYGGIILWYDFVYDNPKNIDVKSVKKTEIIQLFPSASSIEFHRVTLAPPIGRRIGKWYNFFNILFPFLRTHIIAIIQK